MFIVLLQELQYQQAQSSKGPADKFVSVVGQFITVASFSFSEVEELLSETKELVSDHLYLVKFQLIPSKTSNIITSSGLNKMNNHKLNRNKRYGM